MQDEAAITVNGIRLTHNEAGIVTLVGKYCDAITVRTGHYC
jgi:hypothetical protein